MSVRERLAQIESIGRDNVRGGYSRHLLDDADLALRDWFRVSALRLGLSVEQDGNGNLWAWWGDARHGAIATGSHLDSVPGGGAFDGPLGVVSALEAVAILQTEGWTPERPVVVAAFAEEEGSRFGVPCLGSRLMTGEIDPAELLGSVDSTGVSLGEAWRDAGLDVTEMGPDPKRVAAIDTFIELHIEQGLDLETRDMPLAVGHSILAHGRWRLTINGEGNHAGTTPMEGRRDPVVALALATLAVREVALERRTARGTVGRVSVTPNGTNVIASRADLWLDIRAESDTDARAQFDATIALIRERVAAEGCGLEVREESYSPLVVFDESLTIRVSKVLGGAPVIPTGAGHDAGILSAYLPSGMIFVRNPTGVSHAPGESARIEDCETGAVGLAEVIRELAGKS